MTYNNLLLTEMADKFRIYTEYKQTKKYGNKKFSFGDIGSWLYDEEGFKHKLTDSAKGCLKFISNKSLESFSVGEITNQVMEAVDIETDNKKNILIYYMTKSNFSKKCNEYDNRILDELFYSFYNGNDDETSFNNLTEIFGRQYPLISYLFFIKDSKKYLPVSPQRMEVALTKIGCDLKLDGRCSWKNYIEYICIVNEVRKFLESKFSEIVYLDLIDAHSFLWIIAAKDFDEICSLAGEKKQSQLVEKSPPTKLKKSTGKLSAKSGSSSVKKDYIFEAETNQSIGNRGEELVFKMEQAKIENAKKENKIDNDVFVEWVSKKDDSLGYDIRSYDIQKKEPMYIEVKTTTCSKNTPFFISCNEVNFSRNNPNEYYIYRVYDLTKKTTNREIPYYKIQGNIENNDLFSLEPIKYEVKIKEDE